VVRKYKKKKLYKHSFLLRSETGEEGGGRNYLEAKKGEKIRGKATLKKRTRKPLLSGILGVLVLVI